MNRNIFLKCIVCVTFCLQNVQSAVYKVDLTVWQNNRFVDLAGSAVEEYRGYVSGTYIPITFNIGRTSYTGTGDVGQEVVNPVSGGQALPANSGFPSGSLVGYSSRNGAYRNIIVKMDGSDMNNERIGTFYATGVVDDQFLQITTIKHAKNANITPLRDTISTSIGESITLHVNSMLDPGASLIWLHNGNPTTETWNGQTMVTLENVRKGDEGIYECYEDGHQEDGVHAIMRLIVRACPARKYGSLCEMDCPTCYNGGICHEEDGTCVCLAGFRGENCEIDCGNNLFGAECSFSCSSSDSACVGQYFCVPDPIGCSCSAGFTGETCDEVCPTGSYGASCRQTCHCSNVNCDAVRGCTDDTCWNGYSGYQCQVPASCSGSIFGELCNFECHCQYDGGCNKGTGVCNSGQCAEGWGGPDCQQALPSLYNEPTVSIEGTTATVQWNAWDQKIDYGTGPIEKYKVYYPEQGQPLVQFVETTGTEVEIPKLSHETHYDFGISVIRQIGGVSWEGIIGPVKTTITGCGVPTNSPTITQVLVQGPTSLEVHWTVPTGADWIKCSSGIAAFIIQYDSIKLPVEDSTARKTLIEDLNSCTKYDVSIRIRNDDYLGLNSSSVQATTAPSKVTSLDTTPTYDSLYLTWNKPSDCTLDNYMVSHQLTNLDQCLPVQTQPTNETTSTTSITIPGLQSYSTYAISVYAVLDGAEGEQASDNAVTDETVPSGTPTDVTTDTSVKQQITFLWDLPLCGSRNGAITMFEYVIGRDLESGDATLGSTEPEIKSKTFDNLDHYVLYQFKIRANTSAGAGPYTDVIEVRTAESTPSAPRSLLVLNMFSNSIELSWVRPSDLNGVLSEYVITGKTGGKEYTTSIAAASYEETVIGNLTNLESSSQYLIHVRGATAGGGVGPISNEVIGETLVGNGKQGLNSSIVLNIILSVAVGLLMLILSIIAVLYFGRRCTANQPRNENDSNRSANTPVTKDTTSPVTMSTINGYAQYIAPSEEERAYEDLSKPSAHDDLSDGTKPVYINTSGDISGDEVVYQSAETDYEMMPDNNEQIDTNAYDAVC